MNKLMKILGTCMIVTLLIILCSCNSESKDDMKRDFKGYMKNEHSMKFDIKSMSVGYNLFTHGFKGKSDKCVMYPINEPSKTFIVSRSHDLIGVSNDYDDGYYDYLLRPLVKQRLKGIIKNKFNDFKYAVNIKANYQSSDKSDFNINSILKQKGDFTIILYILVDDNNISDKNQIASRMYEFMNEIEKSNLISNSTEQVNVESYFYFVNNKFFSQEKVKDLEETYDYNQDRDDVEKKIPFSNKVETSIVNRKYYDTVDEILEKLNLL
ncbi:hypothetical protein [Clostridium felsineum]|uniref:Uncharacterized protein n=2 Tax=Clostridium felsineum TaxID=36839 RepID=A0A1S8LBQ2_9CLOT|nr:hypothetical protein [Clostridium felsineum]URZ07347.1 hypothetical protein CLROS_026850 [Clostridium felsineum]URZ12378.1 hypothetical protein CROST_031000 [Clostridium felsineum]